MSKQIQILLIDDDEEEYLLLKDMLEGQRVREGAPRLKLDWTATYEDGLKAFAECVYDAYLIDYRLGGRSGLDLLQEAVVQDCPSPIIILTGQGSYETDLYAMQSGAMDYLEKGQLTLPLLERSIRFAINRKELEAYMKSLLQERAETMAKLVKQAQELDALHRATSSLLKTLDLSHLMGEILDAAQEAIPATERSWLHLFENDSRLNKLAQMNFDDARVRKTRIFRGRRDALQQVFEGQAVLIPETGGMLSSSIPEDESDRSHIRSAIAAPLRVDEDVFGALLLSASRPTAFSKADLQLLMSFAATATAAIHNSLLYMETQNLAATDPLTDQFNRRTFMEYGKREIERSRRFSHPVSVLMFDVDRFKEINDRYGHLAGDQVLISIVKRCCRIIRHVDIFGRYGGDEFAILLPETGRQLAQEIAERIRNSIVKTPVQTDAGPISVSVSMGVAEAARNMLDFSSLLEKADQALYRSKQGGRNRITLLE